MDYQVTEGVSPRFVRLVKVGVKSLEKKNPCNKIRLSLEL